MEKYLPSSPEKVNKKGIPSSLGFFSVKNPSRATISRNLSYFLGAIKSFKAKKQPNKKPTQQQPKPNQSCRDVFLQLMDTRQLESKSRLIVIGMNSLLRTK